jgi:hypothetical protein
MEDKEETPYSLEDKHSEDGNDTNERNACSEGGEEIPPEIAENPDAEDPRLYSPLQEADRPDPEQRVQPEDESQEETTKDKKTTE